MGFSTEGWGTPYALVRRIMLRRCLRGGVLILTGDWQRWRQSLLARLAGLVDWLWLFMYSFSYGVLSPSGVGRRGEEGRAGVSSSINAG